MKRVLVIGSPGAGKTTFAVRLARATGLPAVHLDRLFWKSGWVESSAEEFDERLAAELAKPAWIIDGNYNRTLGRRLAACDTAIFLDYPPALCLLSVLWRRVIYNGKVRFDMPEGCPEAIERDFLKYIAGFRKKYRAGYLAIPASHPGIDFYVLGSRRQGRRFLERLGRGEQEL